MISQTGLTWIVIMAVAIPASAALHKPVQTANGALQGVAGKDSRSPSSAAFPMLHHRSAISLESASAGSFVDRHSPRERFWKYLRAKSTQTRILLSGGIL